MQCKNAQTPCTLLSRNQRQITSYEKDGAVSGVEVLRMATEYKIVVQDTLDHASSAPQ